MEKKPKKKKTNKIQLKGICFGASKTFRIKSIPRNKLVQHFSLTQTFFELNVYVQGK